MTVRMRVHMLLLLPVSCLQQCARCENLCLPLQELVACFAAVRISHMVLALQAGLHVVLFLSAMLECFCCECFCCD